MFVLWQLAVGALLCALCFLRGAGPERYVSAALLGKVLLATAQAQIIGHESAWSGTPWLPFWLSLPSFAVICAVALTANRAYTLWIGATQIVCVATCGLNALLPRHGWCTWQFIGQVADAVALGLLALGLSVHIVRTQRLGRPYPSWTP